MKTETLRTLVGAALITLGGATYAEPGDELVEVRITEVETQLAELRERVDQNIKSILRREAEGLADVERDVSLAQSEQLWERFDEAASRGK